MKKRTIFSDIFILPAVLGILVLIMIISSPVTMPEGCKFYFTVIFSVLIPGIAVCRILCMPQTDILEEVVCGYGMGYVLVILQYFFLAFCHKLQLFSYVQFVVGGAAVIFLFGSMRKGRIVTKEEIKKGGYLLFGFILLVFSIRYFTYYGLNLLPSAEQDVTFPIQDILYYIGNAVSAKKGFPLKEFRFLGPTFKYHYFGSIFLGVMSMLTGIDALKLEVCLQWIQPVILGVSAFYVLMRRMKIQGRFCFLGMLLFLFTAGRESLVYVAYQQIMYKSPFGYDLGLAMGILFVLYLYMQHSLQKFHFGVFAMTMLSFFACEGTKAPIAVVLLFFAGCVCFLWLLSPGKRKWSFFYGIPLVIIFLAVFFGFVSDGMSTLTTNAAGLRFDVTGHLYECGLGKLYFEWTAQGVPGWLGKLAILLMYFIGCNITVYCLLLVFIQKAIRLKASWFFSFDGCVLLSVVFGLVLTLLTKQTGNSQMYFAMTSFPFAVILSMRLWNQFEIQKEAISGKLFYGVFAVLFLVGVISFVQVLSPFLMGGHRKLIGTDTCAQVNNSITFEEMEAYEWIRTNTPEDAVCMTNVILDDAQYESFVVGVCTERQMYMEGWRYVAGYLPSEMLEQRRNMIRGFFRGEETAVENILDEKIDYIIWVKRYNEEGEEKYCLGTKVFENSAVSVYDVLG